MFSISILAKSDHASFFLSIWNVVVIIVSSSLSAGSIIFVSSNQFQWICFSPHLGYILQLSCMPGNFQQMPNRVNFTLVSVGYFFNL